MQWSQMILRLNFHRATLGVWLGLAGLTAVFFLIHSNFAQDDAYITYRYARNLSAGLGFVYNANEWVLGTTTPLFTLLLAAGAYLTRLDVTTVSLLFGFVSLWFSAGLLYQLGRPFNSDLALAAAIVFLADPFLRLFMGMESYFLIGLLLATIYMYTGQRLLWTAVLSGLLILVRYEMVFLVGVIYLADAVQKRKFPLWIWPGLVPLTSWLIFATLAFGSPIPLSASVKLAAPRIPFLLGAAVYWYSFVLEVGAAIILIVYFCLGLGGIMAARRFMPGYGLVYLCGGVYLGIAAVFAGSFPWYYAPLIPVFALTVVQGVEFVLRPGLNSLLNSKRLKWPIHGRILLGVNVALVVLIQLSFWYKTSTVQRNDAFDFRYVPYQHVANWLNQNTSPSQSIATFEIGYIGYFTNMRIIDLAGLVTPGLYPWVAEGDAETLAHSLEIYSPDFVLVNVNSIQMIAVMSADSRYQMAQAFDDRYLLYGRGAAP